MMRFLNGFLSFDDGKKEKEREKERKKGADGRMEEREREREWDDIYREIKKSGEKLSVTGARPRPRI